MKVASSIGVAAGLALAARAGRRGSAQQSDAELDAFRDKLKEILVSDPRQVYEVWRSLTHQRLTWYDVSHEYWKGQAHPSNRIGMKGGVGFVDWSGLDLKGMSFAGLNFSHIELLMLGSDLTATSWADAYIHSCDMNQSRCRGADLTGSTWYGVNMAHTQFMSARADGVSIKASHLVQSDWTDAKLCGATFNTSELDYAQFAGADMRGAHVYGCSANYTQFERCDMTGANFARQGPGGPFSDYYEVGGFSGANFSQAVLTGATFDGCDLTNASFRGARLDGTKFGSLSDGYLIDQHTIIDGADFRRCDLRRADFRGARAKPGSVKWPENFNPARQGFVT